MTKYTPRKNFSVSKKYVKKWEYAMEKVDEAIKKKLLISRSDLIVKSTMKEIDELEKRGFFKRGDKTLDDYITNNEKVDKTLDLYSRISPIYDFHKTGVDGEIDMKKIFYNNLDCFPNGLMDYLMMWRNSEAITRQVNGDPQFKNKLERYERDLKSSKEFENRKKALREMREWNSI